MIKRGVWSERCGKGEAMDNENTFTEKIGVTQYIVTCTCGELAKLGAEDYFRQKLAKEAQSLRHEET